MIVAPLLPHTSGIRETEQTIFLFSGGYFLFCIYKYLGYICRRIRQPLLDEVSGESGKSAATAQGGFGR
jgi:hypothetical protein